MTSKLRLTIQMVLIARRWRSLLDDHLRPLGQSAARMEAMATIAYAPPSTPQIEIAKSIGIEGATLTRMLDSLEGDGLVERLPDPSDRRTKHIRLTDAGEAALEEILDVADELREWLLDDVSGQDIDEANAFLGRLLARLNEPSSGRKG
jgi:MarR family transcriptional regulator for hemolysin